MKIELEKKFLIINNEWKKLAYKKENYTQGYILIQNNNNFIQRVRLCDQIAKICIKYQNKNNKTIEIEYNISKKDAKFILKNICIKPLIKKVRYFVKNNNLLWTIDVFKEENKGLVLAEVELKNEKQKIIKPNWIGNEVTKNNKYLNCNLVLYPFIKWKNN